MQIKSSFIYDEIFQVKSDFNPKAHRDDRQHSKFVGLNQAKEVFQFVFYFNKYFVFFILKEKEKSYPSRSSSEYGRRNYKFNHFNQQSHVKIEHIKNDFYRNNGIIHQ